MSITDNFSCSKIDEYYRSSNVSERGTEIQNKSDRLGTDKSLPTMQKELYLAGYNQQDIQDFSDFHKQTDRLKEMYNAEQNAIIKKDIGRMLNRREACTMDDILQEADKSRRTMKLVAELERYV